MRAAVNLLRNRNKSISFMRFPRNINNFSQNAEIEKLKINDMDAIDKLVETLNKRKCFRTIAQIYDKLILNNVEIPYKTQVLTIGAFGELGAYLRACDLFSRACLVRTPGPLMYTALLRAAYQNDKFSDTTDIFLQGSKLYPNNEFLHKSYLFSLFDQKHYNEVIQVYKAMAASESKIDPYIYQLVYKSAVLNHDYSFIIDNFEKIPESMKNGYNYYYILGLGGLHRYNELVYCCNKQSIYNLSLNSLKIYVQTLKKLSAEIPNVNIKECVWYANRHDYTIFDVLQLSSIIKDQDLSKE